MISQSQAVDSARRALDLCVVLLSKSPDSVTSHAASSEDYKVIWDHAYSVWVSKQSGVVRRITTIRNRTIAARRQYGPMTQIKGGADFASWRKLAAQVFQVPRAALPISSKMANFEFKFHMVPHAKNWPMLLPFVGVSPGLTINVWQATEGGPQVDVRNEWRYDFEPWPSRWIDPTETFLRAKAMLANTDAWQKRGDKVQHLNMTAQSVKRVCAIEDLHYIAGGNLNPHYYSQLQTDPVSFGDDMAEKYPQHLIPALRVDLNVESSVESFVFRAADGRLIGFSSLDPVA